MLGATMVPALPVDGGGSWPLAIISLVLLAVFTWGWIARMRRRDRTYAEVQPPAEEYRKAA